MSLKPKKMVVGDLTVRYFESGNEHSQAGTVVLIHGWGISSYSFRGTLERLKNQFHVVAIDLPGFGGSQRPPSYWGYEAYASLIVRVLDKLDIQKAHFIGQSTGGGIALTIAACFPERVRSLVLVNSTGIPMKRQPTLWNRTREVVEQYWRSGFKRENLNFFRDVAQNTFTQMWYFATSMGLPIKHDIRHLLPKVQAPTLIVWGPRDTMLPIDHAHEFVVHMPHSKLVVVENGFHEWCFLYPDEFSELVHQFYHDVSL